MIYINNGKLSEIELTKDNFYLAIDFDKTITARESMDSWDSAGNVLGEEFKKESFKNYQKYAPIELNYNISFEEKERAMEEWYYSAIDLYYKYNLTKGKLIESINTSKIIFRKGAKEFLEKMYKNNIPVIILSAGIGNVIEQFLQNNNCYFDNMKIISNFLSFDENGNMEKYKKDIIHTLNKNMAGNISEDLSIKLKNKEYRLLLGDFVEDKKMIEKDDWDKTISIGFLDKNVETNLETYKANFDIVLTNREANFIEVEKLVLKHLN